MLTVTDIPLNCLIPSDANVRRTGQSLRLEELAASIQHHGLLQNLTVRLAPREKWPVKKRVPYEVIAGGRRLAALKLLAKRKLISPRAPVPCHILTEENATEISLAENTLHCPMHPADQFDAFFALHDKHGMSAEDIAARFGVTADVVQQRLKLACVSPKLIEAYRRDEMNLRQLTAFTITDDQARQEAVWDRSDEDVCRETLLARLTPDQVKASDPRARYVGKEAYVVAGGTILRDLFDEEGESYFAEPDLLDWLADEKLQAVADKVKTEGWQWVTTMRRYDYAETVGLRRIFPRYRQLDEAEQARLDLLNTEYDTLSEDEETDEQAGALISLNEAIKALRGPDIYQPGQLAIAGAIVALDRDGEVRIERGFVRPEDDPGEPAKPRVKAEGPAPLSASLVQELTAQQTMSLRASLGSNGEVALIALTHALAAALFMPYARVSCLEIRASSRCLDAAAPGVMEGPAGQRVSARHEAWAKRLPEEAGDLWAFVLGLSTADRLDLLAHCTGLTIDATRPGESEGRPGVAELAQAVDLDMRADWQPTASNYFGRISRDRILKAVREGASPEAADNLVKLKKAALAEQAERRLRDKGWLPPLLRLPDAAAPAPCPLAAE